MAPGSAGIATSRGTMVSSSDWCLLANSKNSFLSSHPPSQPHPLTIDSRTHFTSWASPIVSRVSHRCTHFLCSRPPCQPASLNHRFPYPLYLMCKSSHLSTISLLYASENGLNKTAGNMSDSKEHEESGFFTCIMNKLPSFS
ncbi:hypothetical protein BT96DRAFT_71248 [Gymnopus androsaceus JB14]|uniref:Uncharacterized protein n=1 Tax=Gymnopus androsaceus JB14 TaxID=1447944 RepID=A0A6A4HKX8_9AGAR|nr:hypothetical protein BT96DRAFT_71248 [Gymnopus androsaceus JB14]